MAPGVKFEHSVRFWGDLAALKLMLGVERWPGEEEGPAEAGDEAGEGVAVGDDVGTTVALLSAAALCSLLSFWQLPQVSFFQL